MHPEGGGSPHVPVLAISSQQQTQLIKQPLQAKVTTLKATGSTKRQKSVACDLYNCCLSH